MTKQTNPTKTTFTKIKEMAEAIEHGEWDIRVVIYDGKVMGFDQIKPPLIKFRERFVRDRG